MYETVLNYQEAMGWDDREMMLVLSDFIETLLTPTHEAHERADALVVYMKRRAKEEEYFKQEFASDDD